MKFTELRCEKYRWYFGQRVRLQMIRNNHCHAWHKRIYTHTVCLFSPFLNDGKSPNKLHERCRKLHLQMTQFGFRKMCQAVNACTCANVWEENNAGEAASMNTLGIGQGRIPSQNQQCFLQLSDFTLHLAWSDRATRCWSGKVGSCLARCR